MTPFVNIAGAAGVIEDAPRLSAVLFNALQFLLSIAGTIAIIGLVAAGVMYATAAGSEDRIKKAKKALLYSVIGIVVVLGGYVLIKTLSSLLS